MNRILYRPELTDAPGRVFYRHHFNDKIHLLRRKPWPGHLNILSFLKNLKGDDATSYKFFNAARFKQNLA